MAATGINLNWSSVEFASTTYTKVTGGNKDAGGGLIFFLGDMNIYPIVAAISESHPTMTFTLGDVGSAELLEIGTTGSLVATLADAKGQTGGGVTFTCTSATVGNVQTQAQHGQFASSTITWAGVSSDGLTNPFVVSRV